MGSSIWIRKIDAAGNDANERAQAVELPSGATKLKYAVVNNGDQPLTDVKVADEVKVGNAKVKNLKCVFPDKTEGTQWAGPFKPQATFNCTAELSEVVGYHHNEASVTVTGVNHEPITRTDPYWAHKHERVAVGNKVWIDANRNGKLDEGEPGKGDVSLTISRSDGQPVTAFDGSAYTTTTTTSADGDYMFENLAELPADVRYVVSIAYPAGYVATKANVGGDEGVDNNSSTDSATSTALTGDGDKDLTLDFGLVKPLVSVGDRVWWDVNRNGQQDEGEKPVKGVVVKLYDAAGAKVSETTTNDKGFYSFTNLIGGDDYTIEFIAPEQTAFTTLDTVADEVDSDANPATGKVSFTAPATGGNSAETPDNPNIDAGLLQLNLQLSKKLTTEGTVLPGGEVVFTLTPKNEGPVDAIPGWSVTDVLPAGLTLTGMTGDGYTCDTATANCVADEVLAAGMAGKPITVTATVNADATGTLHNVAYVAPHDTEIAETNPLAVPTTGTDTDSTDTDNDAQADLVITPLVSVGDHVWWDTNRDGKQSEGEKPVAGVTVKLYNEAGDEVSQTTTSESGFYSFANLTAGAKYTVEFVAPKDTAFTTKDAAADEVDSDADPATGKVSFTAPSNGDNSVAKPDNATIDAGLLKLNLTLVKQLKTKGAIYPGDTVEFTLTPKNEGPVDALAGWSVTDVLPKGLTVKSISGDGYACDTEQVSCVAEAGLAAGVTGKPVTVTATVNADATGVQHNVAYVAPHKTETAETNPLAVPTTGTDTDSTDTDNDAQADLTVSPLVSVGDYVWWDVNRNGQQDEGEKPVAGVTVKLYDADGKQIAETETDKNGFYSFTNLKSSQGYSLEFVKPADTFFTTATSGTAETDSDADPATGKVNFTAPATGSNSATQPDNATLDAGLLQFNLTLTKQLETKGAVLPGSEIVFTLTPANEGPVDALAGWTVTDVLPKGLTFKRITGDGYICDVDNVNCMAEAALPAGQAGKPVTVTAVVDTGITGELHNVAYIEPSDKDIAETNPLGDKPGTDTNTDETKTDNDAQARVKVSVPVVPEKPGKPKLAMTGAEAPAFAGIAVVMLLAGVALITRSRRTVS